jgi:hypothetical protein
MVAGLTEFNTSWHSYPSVHNLGHPAISQLLTVPVQVEEKIDGSQFSFGLFPDTDTPVVRMDGGVGYGLKIRSRGAVMHPDAPVDMFKRPTETVKSLIPMLKLGWTYRGEVLVKKQHNALAYDRTPEGYIIIWDINPGYEEYLDYQAKAAEAARLGLECVPLLYTGMVAGIEQFRTFLDTTSCLGGQKIEGVVVKPLGYSLFGTDKKVLIGKFVSEAFKEVHRKTWGESNPAGKDILALIGAKYTTAARWQKALAHLRETGKIEDSPRDIGLLINEVPVDVLSDSQDEIKEALFKWAWPHIKRQVTRGLAEWYKEKLLEKSFSSVESHESVDQEQASPDK